VDCFIAEIVVGEGETLLGNKGWVKGGWPARDIRVSYESKGNFGMCHDEGRCVCVRVLLIVTE